MSRQLKKLNRRKVIAKSTCDLFIKKGFVNISISEIAKVAGIGKGTIYEYFSNKEDIIFELMSYLQEEYDPKLQKNLQNSITTKEKVKYLFDLFLSDEYEVKRQKKIYKEFIAISLNNPSKEIIQYQKTIKTKYIDILLDIFKEAIEKKEIKQNVLGLVPSIFATMEGFFIVTDDTKPILDYIDNLFEIVKYKE